MSEETAVVEAPEVDEFNAGFDGTEATTTTPEPVAEEAAPQEAEPTPEYVQLTREDLESLKAKAAEIDSLKDELHRKVSGAYGKIGGIEQKLGSMQQARQPVEVTDEDLGELSEYSELASGIKSVLNKVLSKQAGPAPAPQEARPSIDPAQIEALVSQRTGSVLDVAEKKFEARLLTRDHKDWQQVSHSEEFKAWAASKPESFRTELFTSWDADFLSGALTEYKESVKKVKSSQQSRQKIIEAAVTPRGTGGTAPAGPTDDDEFIKGFNGG